MQDEFYELAEPYRRADRRVLMSLDLRDPATAGVTPLHRTDGTSPSPGSSATARAASSTACSATSPSRS